MFGKKEIYIYKNKILFNINKNNKFFVSLDGCSLLCHRVKF